MASEVDIANLALARLGDNATIASIDPPEGSAQAEHAARFYPIARNSLLEMHAWSFATKRIQLAQVTNESSTWDYAYAVPSGMINAIAVQAPDAGDDYVVALADQYLPDYVRSTTFYAQRTPQPFDIEMSSSGQEIILTNQKDAVLRFQYLETDTTKFTPLFTDALSWLLASYMAGPILKGDEGRQVSAQMMKLFAGAFGMAQNSDTNQRVIKPVHIPNWINGR